MTKLLMEMIQISEISRISSQALAVNMQFLLQHHLSLRSVTVSLTSFGIYGL